MDVEALLIRNTFCYNYHRTEDYGLRTHVQEQTNCKKVIVFLVYSKSKDDLHRHLKESNQKAVCEESVDLRQTPRKNAIMKKPQNYQSWAVVGCGIRGRGVDPNWC